MTSDCCHFDLHSKRVCILESLSEGKITTQESVNLTLDSGLDYGLCFGLNFEKMLRFIIRLPRIGEALYACLVM